MARTIQSIEQHHRFLIMSTSISTELQSSIFKLKAIQRGICSGVLPTHRTDLTSKTRDLINDLVHLASVVEQSESVKQPLESVVTPATSTSGSLGAMMARTIADEKSGSIEAATREAQAKSEEALNDFEDVKAFFSKARDHFSECILSGMPTKNIFVQVGSDYTNKSHEEKQIPGRLIDSRMYSVMEAYNAYNNKEQIPTLADHGKYRSLWVDFQAWASDNGLKALWSHHHDGGGMSSWFVLRVQPA
jgi:hypothetical protein